MNLDLSNRYGSWALITGGTSGIGLALARICASNAVNLVLVARNQAKLNQHAAALQKEFGIEVRTISADLTKVAGTQTVINEVEGLDIGILIPCAAIESNGYFVDHNIEQHQAMAQMDMLSPMALSHHFGAQMVKNGRGAILLVSSLSGWMAQPYMAHYGAVKAYILNLAAGLHEEMKDRGVDVSVLSPGPTDTPMAAGTGIDFKSMGMQIMKPEDVAMAGILALGKRVNAVPGFRNKMMVFMMTRLMPRRFVGSMFRKMMGKALNIHSNPTFEKG